MSLRAPALAQRQAGPDPISGAANAITRTHARAARVLNSTRTLYSVTSTASDERAGGANHIATAEPKSMPVFAFTVAIARAMHASMNSAGACCDEPWFRRFTYGTTFEM